jgi:hypothetical protein
LNSIELTIYIAGEKYLDTTAPYTSATVSILDVTGTTILSSNVAGMTDFTGQC